MKKFFIALLFVLLCVTASNAAQKWKNYFNERFEYLIEYPDLFSEIREPDNGDGVWLESKDGKYKLTLSGANNIFMEDGHEFLASLKLEKNIIKKESGSTWFRVVYREKNKIIHYYGIINEELCCSFTFEYPDEKNGKNFDSEIKRMEKSLKLKS